MILGKSVPLEENVIFSFIISQPVGIIEKSPVGLQMKLLFFLPQMLSSFLSFSSAPLIILNTITAWIPIAFHTKNMEKTNFMWNAQELGIIIRS